MWLTISSLKCKTSILNFHHRCGIGGWCQRRSQSCCQNGSYFTNLWHAYPWSGKMPKCNHHEKDPWKQVTRVSTTNSFYRPKKFHAFGDAKRYPGQIGDQWSALWFYCFWPWQPNGCRKTGIGKTINQHKLTSWTRVDYIISKLPFKSAEWLVIFRFAVLCKRLWCDWVGCLQTI